MEKQIDHKVNYHLIEQHEETINQVPTFLNQADLPKKFVWRKTYFNYFEHVKTYPNEYFDFIVVYDRIKAKCSFNATAKLKKIGLFYLDNSETKRYQPLFYRY